LRGGHDRRKTPTTVSIPAQDAAVRRRDRCSPSAGVIQQVQMARMRRQIGQMQKSLDAEMKVKDTMAAILREFRDKVERQK
jgi:hypothetical protein